MLSLSTIADTFPFLRVVLGVVLDAQSLQHEDSRCPGVPCATIGYCLDPESGQAAEQHVPGLEGWFQGFRPRAPDYEVAAVAISEIVPLRT